MDETPQDGVVVKACAWYKSLSQSNDDDSAEDEDVKELGTQELLMSMREMLMQQGQQLAALQNDIRILKVIRVTHKLVC